MKRHWTYYLPEGGTIVGFASAVERLENQIQEYEQALIHLRKERLELEHEAVKRALRDWTEVDIHNARVRSHADG